MGISPVDTKKCCAALNLMVECRDAGESAQYWICHSCGGDDIAFDRNLVALEWGEKLDVLGQNDPGGYSHQVEVHAGLPHWMEMADQPVQGFERNVAPKRVVWHQEDIPQFRFYWLYVPPEEMQVGQEITATIEEQNIDISTINLSTLRLRLTESATKDG